MSSIQEIAQQQLQERIASNPYPGRGLVLGRSGNGQRWVQVYWIMGRSEQSQNRRFVVEGSTMRTEARDPALVADPSLIIYEAMLELPKRFLVSNGDQTRTLYNALASGGSFESAMAERQHEPDAPHYTPRITGMFDFSGKDPQLALSILKASPLDASQSNRSVFRLALPEAGFGYGLTTYAGDGNPLPSFAGDPLLLPLAESPEAILEQYWGVLNPSYLIALAVKSIALDGTSSRIVVRNRF